MSPRQLFNRVIFGACALTFIYAAYTLASALITAQRTGIIQVTVGNPRTSLVVTQTDRQAVNFGTGSSNVRVKSGEYQVIASIDGKVAGKTVSVEEGKTTSIKLNPTTPARLPSPSTITFQGTNSLIEQGLTTDQIETLEQAFFDFKQRAQVVTINSSSLYIEGHNPEDPYFSMSFRVTVDATQYRAVIHYADLVNVDLFLYKNGNDLVFDSTVRNVADEGNH